MNLDFPTAVPGEPQPQVWHPSPWVNAARLEITFPTEGDHCPQVWDMLWDAGKEPSRIAQGVIGCLGEEPKVKKGSNQGALGRKKGVGEIEG